MTHLSDEPRTREALPPRWLMFLMVCLVLLGVLAGAWLQFTFIQDKNTAQANSQTLAQDIKRVCSSNGSLLVDDRHLCAKATQVQQNPTEPLAGPKGDQGAPGINGAGSTIPGPAGWQGKDGAGNSARGAKRFVTDALATLKGTGAAGKVLCRFDSAYYGHAAVAAALAGGAEVSVTVRLDPAVKRAITTITESAWKPIEYTNASTTKTPTLGYPQRKSLRPDSPRSAPAKKPNGSPGAWSCGVSPS